MVTVRKLIVCILFFTATVMHPNDLHNMAGNLCGTWQYVDFDLSMRVNDYPQCVEGTFEKIGVEGEQLLAFFRDLYERNNFTRVVPQEEPRIPKVIHFVWLGGPLPEVLEKYVASWREKHPEGWEFCFWDDAAVKKIQLFNQDLFDSSINLGMKSDILRYELLYRFGGLYVDTDFECLQPVDVLHHTYDFYSCFAPLDGGFVRIANGLIAAKAGHPILKYCVENMRKSCCDKIGVPAKTGPIFLTKSIYELAGKTENIDIVFPATYFYPLGLWEKVAYRSKWKAWGSFGIHWWARTWMPPECRPTKFEKINNYETTKDWDK